MSFCKNCGVELREGAVFCKNCGFRVGDKMPQQKIGESNTAYQQGNNVDYQKLLQDGVNTAAQKAKVFSEAAGQKGTVFTQKVKSDKRYLYAAAGGVVAALVAIAASVGMRQMGKRIQLEDCIVVDVAGYDTKGYANAYLDEEAFMEAAVKAKGGKLKNREDFYKWNEQLEKLDIYEIRDLVSLEIENLENLANGDEVKVAIVYDQDSAKDYGVKFVGESYTYKVEGLPELQQLDPFSGLSVWFEGVAPEVSIRYEYNGEDSLLSTGSFYADTEYGLEIGDKVVISLRLSEEEAVYQGYQLTELSKEYTCENVDTYMENVDQLTESVLEQMKQDALDCIESYFANHYDYIACGELTYEGCYVLISKDTERNRGGIVYVVHSAEVSSKEVYDYTNESRGIFEGTPIFRPQTVYFPVRITDVVCGADGGASYQMDSGIAGETDLEYDGWYSVSGYTNGRKMYNELAGGNKVDFNIEMIENLAQIAEEDPMGDIDYILPDSSSRALSIQDLSGLTKEECRIARNEIYARYGRRFDDAELQAYFDGKDWYRGSIDASDFNDDYLSELEKANRDLIVEYEAAMGYR